MSLWLVMLISWLTISVAMAQPEIKLIALDLQPLPDDRARITLHLDKPLNNKVPHFTTEQPARIVVDLPGVMQTLSSDKQRQFIGLGALDSYDVVEANGRTRLVLNLKEKVNYNLVKKGEKINIYLATNQLAAKRLANQTYSSSKGYGRHVIKGVDFRGLSEQGGMLVLDLSDPNVSVDLQRTINHINIDLFNTNVPYRLQRRLDVTDFGSPVKMVDTKQKGNNTSVDMHLRGDYEHFAYQVDKQFIVEVLPVSSEQARLKKQEQVFTGKRISLNFQSIKVRAVLQLLADFTGINIVVSDSVGGEITLRLNNIPWDQALDIILRTRGLDKREMGSVILIAPAAEIAAREQKELEALRQVEELAPLRSELVQINYAKATEIAKLLKDEGNSLLSQRGSVSVDERTNMLWLQDTADRLEEILALIIKLDIAVKQVQIEARVVTINKDFERDIGVRFGITSPSHLSGTIFGANELQQGTAPADVPVLDRLNVNLPAMPTAGDPTSLGIALAKLGKDVLLDLELSALEAENKAEVISSPRLITANQQDALIESGEEIPYQEATSSGATAVAFKKAVLSLRVTPQITPDKKIILNLKVNQDIASAERINGVPPILTKEIQTNVLVDNGQTIVLGGIYKRNTTKAISRVPFLGTIPVVGLLFSKKQDVVQHEELLIFITPKIIEQSYTT